MNYNETIDFLYSQLPMFERSGANAYKPGLQTSRDLDNMFGNPHTAYKTIHIAGTNGKGSVSSLLAAVLQSEGYKVGLYTSPHLVDFRERIVVNGEKIPQQYVVDFVRRYQQMGYEGHPSFFELTSTMAFDYFRAAGVDYAVIEVGLGGRLDSTNIISPLLCVITNISLDHTQFLGDTLPKIASEKAGIIKAGVPVVVGEAEGEVRRVFERKAEAEGAPIVFAQDLNLISGHTHSGGMLQLSTATSLGTISSQLSGEYQVRNAATVLAAVGEINRHEVAHISDESVRSAFAHVSQLTGLRGRWTTLRSCPLTVCDTGHNIGGWQYLSRQIASVSATCHRMVIGFVKDKDIRHILALMPKDACYYFTQASIQRALDARSLMLMGQEAGLEGRCFSTVEEAYNQAKADAADTDLVFVGGSTYVVAELLALPEFL